MASRAEHYREAERLIEDSEDVVEAVNEIEGDNELARVAGWLALIAVMQKAQVHATLATASSYVAQEYPRAQEDELPLRGGVEL